jgi:hypothetical protein
MHGVVLSVLAEGRVDAKSKKRLAQVAKEALELSQKLQETPVLNEKILSRVSSFLTGVVTIFFRTRHGS